MIGLAEAENLLTQLAGAFVSEDPSLQQFRAKEKTEDAPDLDTRYRTLVEQIPAVIFLASLDEGISKAYVSPYIEDTLGFTQQEWLNDPVRWYRQIHPDDRSRWNIEAAELFLSNRPLRSVYRVIARDGHVVWFDCQAKIVRNRHGRPWFIHGVGFDVSDLKEAEEALKSARNDLEQRVQQRTAQLATANADLQAQVTERISAQTELARRAEELARSNADLEQFAYSASHDLQEPIRNVAIYSELLRRHLDDRLDPESEHFLRLLNLSAQRMDALVRDLLIYARIASAPETPIDTIDSNVALTESLTVLQVAIRDNQAQVSADPLPRVRISPVHLQQLFQNLISNAIKYRSTEPPRIHLSASLINSEWVFSVKDNGIGIAREYHDNIFGMFKRLHSKEQYPGTGMGLAICKRIVDRHGGRIWVESGAGQGASFFFTVRVTPGAAEGTNELQ